MFTTQTKIWICRFAEGLLLVAALTTTVLTAHAQEWSPLSLVGLLFALALVGQRLGVTLRSQQVTADSLALVLAMSLL